MNVEKAGMKDIEALVKMWLSYLSKTTAALMLKI